MEDILKPRICFIGAGNVSEHHIKAAKSSGFDLHGICGRKDSIRAKRIAEKYHFSNYLQSIEEINVNQIDAISIIVDPANLIKIYKKFESTNLAILIEKPVALESSKIETLSKERNRTMVAFNRRYYSSVHQFKRNLSELNYFQVDCRIKDQQRAFLESMRLTREDVFFNRMNVFEEKYGDVNSKVNFYLFHLRYCP